MDFEKVLKTRRSFHSFKEKEVEKEKVRKAVETARNAPSAWNIQPWKITVLETDEALDAAVESSYDQEWMRYADKIAVVLGDTEFKSIERAFSDMKEKGYKNSGKISKEKRMVEGFREKDDDWIETELTSNCIFLASAFMHALWSRGIGSCPVKGFDQRELGETLFDDRWLPILLMPFGYPDEEKEAKYRKDVDELLEFS